MCLTAAGKLLNLMVWDDFVWLFCCPVLSASWCPDSIFVCAHTLHSGMQNKYFILLWSLGDTLSRRGLLRGWEKAESLISRENQVRRICSLLCVRALFYFALPFWVREDKKHLINRSLDEDMCCYTCFLGLISPGLGTLKICPFMKELSSC